MNEIGLVSLMVVGTFSAIICGIHIGISLFFFSLLGVFLLVGSFEMTSSMIGTGPFYVLFNYELCVIPLFILMGDFIVMAGAGKDLYKAFFVLLRKVRGGLAIATVLSNAVFAALTGVSIASAAVFSKIALPEMEKYGYKKKFTLGTIAGSSILGMLIPPSVLFITYGIFAEESIGKLFMAGIIPGFLVTIIYTIGIKIIIFLHPDIDGGALANEQEFSTLEILKTLAETWPVFGLIAIVLGGMYVGFLTPTEAGAMGAIGACLLSIQKGRFKFRNMLSALNETGKVTASFFFLFIGAQLYSRMLALSGFHVWLTDLFMGLDVAPIFLLLLMVAVWFVLGMLIDSISILVLTLPLMLPIARALDFNMIWFGVVAVISVEIGLLTPPFGMVAFVMKGSLGHQATIADIFQGLLPFILMLLIALAILIMFPVLSTWLPAL